MPEYAAGAGGECSAAGAFKLVLSCGCDNEQGSTETSTAHSLNEPCFLPQEEVPGL